MKLTYLTSLAQPSEWAHSIQIAKMCEAFAETGGEVTLVFPKRSLAASTSLYEYHGVQNNFALKTIKPLDLFPTSPSKLWYYVRTFTFFVQAWPKFLFDSKETVYIREPILGLFLPRFFLEIHSVPKNPSFFFKWVCRRAKGIITITTPLSEIIQQYGVPKNKILVAPSAVDIDAFDLKLPKIEMRKKLHLPLEANLAMYVGGFSAVGLPKGIDTMIQTIALLPNNFTLVLVGGESKDIEKYKKYANTLNVAHKVIFVGQVPHLTTPEYMQAADVLIAVYPPFDFYKYYTSPLKVFEYMAAGRPIVTTDFPTLRDIVDDSSALLVNSQEPRDYADAIRKIVENPTKAESLVQAAQNAIKEYTWKKRAEKISRFMRSL